MEGTKYLRSMNRSLGVGVVGTSFTGRLMVPLMQAAGFNVSAICGTTPDKTKVMAEELGIPFYTSKTDELILRNDVDLVCVFCQPHLKADVAVKALSIGKHVLCEKPMGLNRLEAERMVHAARYYPLLLSVVQHVYRFLNTFKKMKQLVKEGYCGDVMIIDCRIDMGSLLSSKYDWICDQIMGGGSLHIYGSHFVDLVTFLTNQRAVEVHGVLQTFVTQTENISNFRHITSDDFCSFQMKLDGGIFCNCTLNHHFPGQFNQEVIVIGSKGRLVARNADLYGVKNTAPNREVLIYKEPMKYMGVKSSPAMPKIFLVALEAWIQCIKGAFHAEPVGEDDPRMADLDAISEAATFEDGYYNRLVLDCIIESSKNKKWIIVPPVSEALEQQHISYWSQSTSQVKVINKKTPTEPTKKRDKHSPLILKRGEKK